jgi:hypothetical protein
LVIWWYMLHICYNILWKLLRDWVYYIYTEIKKNVLYVLINYIAIILESITDIFMYTGSIGTPWINPKLYIFGMVNQDQPRRNCEGDLTPNTKHQGRRTVLMRIWPEAHTLTILKATRMTKKSHVVFLSLCFSDHTVNQMSYFRWSQSHCCMILPSFRAGQPIAGLHPRYLWVRSPGTLRQTMLGEIH